MKTVASLGLTVVSVIHQPRCEIFEQIDDLLMISPGGRTAFLGPTKQVISYFENLGFLFRPNSNPADTLMDILSGNGASTVGIPLTIDEIVQAWDRYVLNGFKKNSPGPSPPSTRGGTPETDGPVEDMVFGDLEGNSVVSENCSEITFENSPRSSPVNEVARDSFATKCKNGKKNTTEFHKIIKSIISKRGASTGKQIYLVHNRSVNQMFRKINGLWIELGVATAAGFAMGVANIRTRGELYRGILVEPYALISPSPVEWLVPLMALLSALTVAFVGSPAGVKLLGEERHIFFREAASGHNRFAYYVGKMISAIYRYTLSALHFSAVLYYMATPQQSYTTVYIIFLGLFFNVYGMANVVGTFVRRENATLIAAIATLFSSILSGFAPTLREVRNWGLLWFWDMQFARWAIEAFYASEVVIYKGLFNIDNGAAIYGFTLGRVPFDFAMLFTIGFVYQVLGFVFLIIINRDKQR